MVYTADALANVRGGTDRGGSLLGNLDLVLEVGLDALPALGSTSLVAYVLWNHGDEPSGDRVGDAQGIDNIETPTGLRLYELLLERRFAQDHASLLVGLYDLNSEFDVVEPADVFIHSSFGIGPDFSSSGFAGPSIFPYTALAARVRGLVGRGVVGQVAVLDGSPGRPEDPSGSPFHLSDEEGALLVGEVAWHWEPGGEGPRAAGHAGHAHASRLGEVSSRGKVALGAWRYTARFPRLDGSGAREPATGAYLLAWARAMPEGGPTLFARVGVGAGAVSEVAGYVGGGIVWPGPFPGRPDDVAGLGVASAAPSDALAAGPDPGTFRETALEATYRAVLAPWLEVQGDVQHVRRPGFSDALEDAWVIGLRVVLTR